MAKRKPRETTTRTQAVFTAEQLAELKGTVREFLRLFTPRAAFGQGPDGNHFRVTRVDWNTAAMMRVFLKAQDFTNRITLGDRYGKKPSDADPKWPEEWATISGPMLTFQQLDKGEVNAGKIGPAAVEAAIQAEDLLSRFAEVDTNSVALPVQNRDDFAVICRCVDGAQHLFMGAILMFRNLFHYIAMVRAAREQDRIYNAGDCEMLGLSDGPIETQKPPVATMLRDGQKYLRAIVTHLEVAKPRTRAASLVVPRSIEPDPIGYETRLNAAIESALRVAHVNASRLAMQSQNVLLSMTEDDARAAERECKEAADALDAFHRVWRALPEEAANRIERPDFHLTTDIRATSDPLWKHLAAFRRWLMDGGTHTPAEWQSLLIDIRSEAHAAGLRPHLGEVEFIVATLSEARDGDPAGGWEREPDSWSKVILIASGEAGWIQLHDLVDGFTDAGIPAGGHKRTSAIEWAESWMNARERQLCRSQTNSIEPESKGPVPKPDGWTKSEIVSQAVAAIGSFSNSTFDTIRSKAGVHPSQKGGAGPHRRFSRRELGRLIQEASTGPYRKGGEIAEAWRELLNVT